VLKKCFSGLLIIIAAIALIGGAGYLKSMIWPGQPEFPAHAEVSPEELSPGEEAEYRFELNLPLDMRLKECLPQGEKLLPSSPDIEFSAWHWDRAVWSVNGKLRFLESGRYPETAIRCIAENSLKNGQEEFTVNIPALTVTGLPENRRGEELIPAPATGKEDTGGEKKKSFFRDWRFLTAAACGIAVIAAVIFALWKQRRRKMAALPLDEKTIREIEQLNKAVKSGKVRTSDGIAILCDIIRNYLEKRFAIPVTRRTTVEFIKDIARADLLLPEDERIFLTGFMNSADLIKFAGKDADREMLDDAAGQAVELVRITTIHEEKKQ